MFKMSCKKIKILLSSYADDEIKNIEEKAAIIKHLGACQACETELAKLNAVKKLFTLRTPAAPDDFFETRLSARIAEYEQQSVRQLFIPFLWKTFPVFVCLCIAIFGAISVRNHLYKKPVKTVSDVLVDRQSDGIFDTELIELYYGPGNGQGEKNEKHI